MAETAIYAGIAAALIASFGLWWLRLVVPVVKKQPKTTRFSIYALVWLAYFITVLVMIGKAGGQ